MSGKSYQPDDADHANAAPSPLNTCETEADALRRMARKVARAEAHLAGFESVRPGKRSMATEFVITVLRDILRPGEVVPADDPDVES